MKLFNVLLFFPLITSGLNTIIPVRSNSLQDFYNCINNINFFKLNMKFLGCENAIINQNLDESKINWPVVLSYDRKHQIKKYPSLPIPKMRTEEQWNINTHRYEITGTIKTRLITITLNIKINEPRDNYPIIKKKRSLLMQTKVDYKSFIIPISNSEIESDVTRQIIDNMKLALKEMSNMGICEIEIMDIIY